MIATITDIDVHRPQREALAGPAARVMLKSPDAPPGLLDGAWWPRSRDLLRELPALVAVLDDALGSRITRIAVNPEHWPVIPRKIPVAGHVVKAGWFKEQDPHKLLLLSYSAGRYDLLVIPPHTSADAAARLMAAATDAAGRPLTASALIAEEEVRHGTTAVGRALDPDESKEYEGGATSTHIGVPDRPSRLLVGM
ncbi:DUF5994 family protein [Streptomyces sp. WM6378]|uniref:DUF5994 family protein n=1 Tax=Streptomyces sp. WM6378 TaxID=1415557 RepID=UPI0006C057B9|nr:DUF5994 family protein [Streptomyces sp. WM6378]KOU49132.1 hypothetical protein ADK54_10990 [Streptomyces sp. WM6378]